MKKNGKENGTRRPQMRQSRSIEVQIGRFLGIEFCPHAIDRMNERSISESDVIDAIRNPMKRKCRVWHPGRKCVRKRRADGLTFRVVYKELTNHILVISVIPED